MWYKKVSVNIFDLIDRSLETNQTKLEIISTLSYCVPFSASTLVTDNFV